MYLINYFQPLHKTFCLKQEYDPRYRKVWETDQNKGYEVSAFA